MFNAAMAEPQTPSQALAEVVLGRPLSEYVAEKRSARPQWSWQLISEQLTADTDGRVTVTRETLRQWYGIEAAERAEVAG